jgi:DNA adenine methylase
MNGESVTHAHADFENSDYSPIAPPITWFGSKSRYIKRITAHFPKHQAFVDVFGDSGAVLLGKKPSKVEVYNDLNHKLVNLFRVLSDPLKAKELARRLNATPYARQEFKGCLNSIDSELDDIELARKMLVIQRQSHGGHGQHWSYCVDNAAAGYSASVRKFHAGVERLGEISKRLRKVQIEDLPWEEMLKRYDGPDTLFYLDPPYIPETRVRGSYEHEMSPADHENLVLQLQHLKGASILSGYKHPLYEPLEQAGWKRVEFGTFAYTSDSRSSRVECLWISRGCQKEKQAPQPAIEAGLVSGRPGAAYRTHRLRVAESESQIKEALRSLKRMKRRVTKTEVTRMTGISRGHLSRRYDYLFQ